jgi:hypothetical protein
LFIDGFVPAGGFRLLRVARPTVLNYGLYGPSKITHAELRLSQLVDHRGALARELDCLTDCACDNDTVLAQIVLDKLLYDIDRSIDFYCVGDADLGLPEVRAAAYGHLIEVIIDPNAWNWQRLPLPSPMIQKPPLVAKIPPPVTYELGKIADLLRPSATSGSVWATPLATYVKNLTNNKIWLGGASSPLRFARVIHDELCLQRDTDAQWRAIVEQMTAGCVSPDAIFLEAVDNTEGCLPLVLDRALFLLESSIRVTDIDDGTTIPRVGASCFAKETDLPPQFEESLRDIVDKL